ncbi:rhodanese-like domain-containing protein [Hymenobacter psychrotolerans]|uniref:Rhodanese-related sulfurtransferase n=1 Tax=Hymenobacter psychrotolerans DSM 18569 TaxID=1121959 RepID=A0A1M6SRJ6_9BACT|nr:rhodanese-like domain-containing protein [Hymenobacter psychrotolerans]SHK47257.1 Rhodanese-related sulfurtransferase [Hymenobacter psychrotolerans DSM 18569]
MTRFLLLASFAALLSSQPTQAQTAPQAVAPAVAAELVRKPNVVMLDVRTPEEFATGHLKGARNLDFRAPGFSEQVRQLDKSKTYVLYCASGNRSGQSMTLMRQLGFGNLVNAGAFKDLKAAGLKAE